VLVGVFDLPLKRSVGFRAVLQKGNRFQVPKLVRWEFRMEPGQVLRVRVGRVNHYEEEYFFGRMSRDGRITIPKLTVDLLQEKIDGKSMVGHVLEVHLSPSG
jgi:bifunctional DNA-binding transcriptional regulator/antitoxin component of YhaV-PrlF toxin-antitoxin module